MWDSEGGGDGGLREGVVRLVEEEWDGGDGGTGDEERWGWCCW